ncbi:MAG TPA: ribonuclease E/G, partial [Anaerolineae bacterium]|nr:ribonuclease E/G [Anaerolineae bacterium]
MKTEIIINAAIHETRIAILEDSKMVEIWVERPDNERMVGDIYKGRVKAVIPGIQAAFVDIGMDKSAFLHISDVANYSIDFGVQYEDEDVDDLGLSGQTAASPMHKKEKEVRNDKTSGKKQPSIESLLSKDQELLVQITKEPISTKGARLTSQISLPGRFLVLMPGTNKVGVSRKIASWSERRRLRQLAPKHRIKGFGLIIRTLAEGKGEEVISSEIRELVETYKELIKKAENIKAPALIYKEMGMTSGIIRDLLSEDIERVVVDSKESYDEIRRYLEYISPNLNEKVILYKDK